MKDKKKKSAFKENIKTIVILVIVTVLVIGALIYNNYFNYNETYTVVKGSVEKASDTYVYVLKNEKVIETDTNTVAIPVIEQDKRTSKGDVIAIYKNSNYDNYQKEIEELDKEIQTLVKDLPSVYSNDVNTIDNQISQVVKEAQKETSYVKMQEYKNRINELLSKKVNIIGQLSPAGSKIRELIEKREKLEKDSKNSNNNIKAKMSGIVTYKLDGLENEIDFDSVLNYNESKFDEIISKYSDNNTNNFGIKIVDNFKCYYLVKENEDENSQYMVEGRNYRIKLIDKNSEATNTAKLEKSIKSNGVIYNLFSIDENIEEIVDVREIGAEIIWSSNEGMAVPLEAITTKNNIDYVTIVTGGEFIDVPVRRLISNDTISIVENYEAEDLQQLGIESKEKLELYDQLLIEAKDKK